MQLTKAVYLELVPISPGIVIGIDQDHALQGVLLPGEPVAFTYPMPDDRCLQVVISETA